MKFSGEKVVEIYEKIQQKRPIIHCITNAVTVNDCANILLAAANPNRLIVAAGRFHHHRKIVAMVFSLTDVTGVDAVLGKGLGTLRDFG